MLIKHTISNRDFYNKAEEFTIQSIQKTVRSGDTYYVTFRINGKYNFNKSGRLKLYRKLDDGDFFEEVFEVTSFVTATDFPIIGDTIIPTVSDYSDIYEYGNYDFTLITIKYPNLYKYFLTPSYFNKDKTYCLENGVLLNGTEIVFDRKKHICIEDRGQIDIKQTLYCGDKIESLGDNFCNGYILYDNRSLYKVTNGSGTLLNIRDHKLIYDGKEYNTYVPFSVKGYDNRNFMLVMDSSGVDFNLSKDFIVADCRFFGKNINKLIAHPNTVVKPFNDTLNIEIPLSSDFSSNLFHDQLLEDYVDEIKNSYVTNPLDYEKRMFTPVYENGNNYFDLNSIRFNIFLRKRHFFEDAMEWKLAKSFNEEQIDDKGNTINVEVWEEDDNAYWNSYFYDGGLGKTYYSGYTINNGDLLGDLGFDDNDVLNQNKRLGKTFIRLLFFDSKDRNTQTLLYYSTIFINTVDFYAKFMNNITLDTILNGAIEYVGNPIKDETLRDRLQLSCNFTCFNKNNMSASSEGYYLYLFPTLVEEGEMEIYMRVEFNHAKYGQTVPMICPREKDEYGNIIQNLPRENYTKFLLDENGVKTKMMVTDLNALYDDMYIPIKIKYCDDKKSYVWHFSDIEKNKNNPTFNLWEPKIR